MLSILGPCLLLVLPLVSCRTEAPAAQAGHPAAAPSETRPLHSSESTPHAPAAPVAPVAPVAPAASTAPTAPTPPAVAPSAPTPSAAVQGGASVFGEPMVIYGRRIGDNDIKRFLCLGVGRSDVDMFKFSVMISQELTKRRQAGATDADLTKFEVSDAELDRRLKREEEDFLLRFPSLPFAIEVGRAELSLDLFRERLRQTMKFDKLFRPDDPKDWPEITVAIIAQNLGDRWFQDEKVSYASRLKRLFLAQRDALAEHGFGEYLDRLEAIPAEDTAGLVVAIDEPSAEQAVEQLQAAGLYEIPGDDPIAVEATRSTILQELNNYAIVYLDPDAIAANLPVGSGGELSDPAARAALADATLMLVEDEAIPISAVWDRIGPYITPDMVDDAKRFYALSALLERDLAAKGTLLSQAEFREWFPSTARSGQWGYIQYLNQHEMLSSQVLGFPSLWAFAQYTRLQESYRRSIADELAKDEMLIPTLPIVNQIAGAAKLAVNVLLVSAYDFDHCVWKQDGWAQAKRKAFDLKKALDEGAEWLPTLELNSEFWDAPMPEMGNKPMQNYYFKGTFGNQQLTRNQLLQYLLESDYRTFLYGPSVSDYVFFEQKLGSIAGPFRGPRGYYLTRITGKVPPSKPLDLKEPVHRQIAEHYYLKNSFNARALALLNDGVASGAVAGVPLGGGYLDL